LLFTRDVVFVSRPTQGLLSNELVNLFVFVSRLNSLSISAVRSCAQVTYLLNVLISCHYWLLGLITIWTSRSRLLGLVHLSHIIWTSQSRLFGLVHKSHNHLLYKWASVKTYNYHKLPLSFKYLRGSITWLTFKRYQQCQLFDRLRQCIPAVETSVKDCRLKIVITVEWFVNERSWISDNIWTII